MKETPLGTKSVEGDRGTGGQGVGAWEKKEQVVYRRQEKMGQEAGEIVKIMQHCTIFCNQKRTKRWEATETMWEVQEVGGLNPLTPATNLILKVLLKFVSPPNRYQINTLTGTKQ